jgi:hypothetical protein
MSTRPTGPGGAFETDQARTEPFTGQPQYAAGQQPYAGQPQYTGAPTRGGDGISASDLAKVARNEFLTRETKPGIFTSEFFSSMIVAIAVLVSAAIVDGPNGFPAEKAWLYVTILSAAYMISRGLAKAGVRHASKHDDRGF